MGCERWREELSAQLDGEEDPGVRAGIEKHLAGCPGCRRWLDQAAQVNRLVGTTALPRVPDLSAAVLAALPGRSAGSAAAPPHGPPMPDDAVAPGRSAWLRTRLFVALGVVGAVQLILGLAQVGRGAGARHTHAGVDVAAGAGHLWHESAAWNVAVGAGFLFIALRRNRPSGLVPMLSAFVGMLLLLSFNDLTAGRVEVSRLVSHGFVIVGYLLVVALSRVVWGDSRPPGERQQPGTGWRLRDASRVGTPTVPALRLLRRAGAGPATAQLPPTGEAPTKDRRRAA